MSQGFSGKNFTKTSITVKEQDGSPDVSKVTTIKVNNDRLTDDGNGEVSVDLVDPQTAANTAAIETLASKTRIERAEQNIILNMFRLQIQNSLSIQSMVDGFADEYEDETGIDAGASINESYDATDDFYESTSSPISSDIVLLLHGDGNDGSTTFVDSSNSAHTMTANGDAQVDTAFSKFGGASMLFDGTGDFLSTPASSDFQLSGTGGSLREDGTDHLTAPDSPDWDVTATWSVDFWVRLNTTSGTQSILAQIVDGANSWNIRWNASLNKIQFISISASVGPNFSGIALTANAWTHIAIIKVGSEWGIYQNGVQTGYISQAYTTNFASALGIGGRPDALSLLNGNLDEVRIVQNANPFGAAPVVGLSDTITIPTSEHVSDANTKLLLHFTSDFTDSGNTGHTISTVGAPVLDNDDFVAFNTPDFTIDAWVRLTDFTPDAHGIVAIQSDITNRWELRINPNGSTTFQIRVNSNFTVNLNPLTGFIAGGAFQHIAVSRSGFNWRFFKDGVQIGSTFFNAAGFPGFSTSTQLTIGARNIPEVEMKGHIDELRITKGVALYTANFTPDASATAPSTDNMTLLSIAQTAIVQPDTARVVILEEDVDSITLNTDLKCFASRDNGTTFTQITLVNEGNFDVNRKILAASIDISGQPAGTSMKYKITTLNQKALKIHATGLLWD